MGRQLSQSNLEEVNSFKRYFMMSSMLLSKHSQPVAREHPSIHLQEKCARFVGVQKVLVTASIHNIWKRNFYMA